MKDIIHEAKLFLEESKNPVNSGKLAAQAIKLMIDRKELKPNWKLVDNEIKFMAVKLKFDTNSKGNLDDYNTFIQSAHSALKGLGVKLKDSPPENRKFNFSSSDYSSRSSSRNSEILSFKNNDSIHDTNIQSMLGL